MKGRDRDNIHDQNNYSVNNDGNNNANANATLAERILQEIIDDPNIQQPNTMCYNSVIRAYAQAHHDAQAQQHCERLFRQLLETPGIRPDANTYLIVKKQAAMKLRSIIMATRK